MYQSSVMNTNNFLLYYKTLTNFTHNKIPLDYLLEEFNFNLRYFILWN